MHSASTGSENERAPEVESSLPFASLFGGSNVCFKTCGMEDIQYAARVHIFFNFYFKILKQTLIFF